MRHVVGLSGLTIACWLVAGCDRPPPERLGYRLTVPADWQPLDANDPLVPGKAAEAWRIPGGGSAVVFTQIPQRVSVEPLMTLTVNQIAAQRPWTLEQHQIRVLGGADAMYVVLSGPGTGDAMAPTPTGEAPMSYKGRPLIPTRRVWVAFVRKTDALHFFFHYPVGREPDVGPVVEGLLRTCRVDVAARTAY